MSIAIGGELKSVERSQTYGMLGAVAGATVIRVVTIYRCNRVFDHEFLGTAAYNPLEGVGIQADPTISLLAGVLTGSPLICILVSPGFIFWMWMWIPGMHAFGAHAIVAVIFVIGLGFYFVMKAIRRAQGVDVTLAFKEIPIE